MYDKTIPQHLTLPHLVWLHSALHTGLVLEKACHSSVIAIILEHHFIIFENIVMLKKGIKFERKPQISTWIFVSHTVLWTYWMFVEMLFLRKTTLLTNTNNVLFPQRGEIINKFVTLWNMVFSFSFYLPQNVTDRNWTFRFYLNFQSSSGFAEHWYLHFILSFSCSIF